MWIDAPHLGRKVPDCGTWDALERVEVEDVPANVRLSSQAAGRPSVVEALPLSAIEAPEVARFSTGSVEFDRVLGGGLVAGSVSLLGGDPGIGKSTLLLQAAAGMARSARQVLYASSEESAYQVRLRAERLVGGLQGLDNLLLLAETSLGRILEQARQHKPDVLVLDSIQLVHHGGVDAVPGTPSQIRHCGSELVHFAKATGTAIVTVGHVTKDGQLAGPRVLEHIVDVVLSFEGDRHHAHRVVRGVKNRFGTTMEVGLFEMTGEGLQPIEGGGALLDSNGMPRPGTVAAPVLFGSRCLLTEVQGLVVSGFLGSRSRGHRYRPQSACDGDCDLGTTLWFAVGRSRHLCRRERRAARPPSRRRICRWLWRLPEHICENPSLRTQLRLVNWAWVVKFVRSAVREAVTRSRLRLARKDFLRFRHASIRRFATSVLPRNCGGGVQD